MTNKIYDVAVIGAGPAGLTASVYLGRAGLEYILFEAGMPGGQLNNTEIIENYTGFSSIDAAELTEKMTDHAKLWGGNPVYKAISSVKKIDGIFNLESGGKIACQARSVIVATGLEPRLLGVKGEDEYRGRGVSYCATCDGAFFRKKTVVVIGGGDSAVEEGLLLAGLASKVSIVHRRDQLRAVDVLQKRAFEKENMDVIWDSVLEEICGDGKFVTHVKIKNVKTGEISESKTDGVFIYVGQLPVADFITLDIDKDKAGFFITNGHMETSVPGLFVAGDLRSKPVRQVANAVGDAATAVGGAFSYL
ncbi:FAD-dependent oxidoreductase, partial [bacterium]|nr:FAD-dependent oxidoreductase [bacterium]